MAVGVLACNLPTSWASWGTLSSSCLPCKPSVCVLPQNHALLCPPLPSALKLLSPVVDDDVPIRGKHDPTQEPHIPSAW